MSLAAAMLDLLAAAVAGVFAPYVLFRMLFAALSDAPVVVTNYRGRPLVPGLGLVWVFWCAAALFAWVGLSVFQPFLGASPRIAWMCIAAMPVLLGAVLFGLIDDSYGSSKDKGFRGHVGALARGRLTTGGLKLAGIGGAALVSAVLIALPGPSGTPVREWPHVGGLGVSVALATACIGLSSNLLNLLDVRPGRALKGYLALCVIALVSLMIMLTGAMSAELAGAQSIAMGLWALGPLVAVWGLDVAERGMLGDSGANAFGAFSGVLLAISLPAPALTVVVVALLALNIASERVSFSAVIERNRLLRAVDQAGLPRTPASRDPGARGGADSAWPDHGTNRSQDGSPNVGGHE